MRKKLLRILKDIFLTKMPIGIHTIIISEGPCYPEKWQILFEAVGDNWNDTKFEKRMNFILEILRRKIGIGNYEHWWSPANSKAPIQMTRSAVARRKLTGKLNKIKHNYPLFADQFINNDKKIKDLLIASVTSLLPAVIYKPKTTFA